MEVTRLTLDDLRAGYPTWRFGMNTYHANSASGGTNYWARRGSVLLAAFTIEGLAQQVSDAD